jgi:hypothetical protein
MQCESGSNEGYGYGEGEGDDKMQWIVGTRECDKQGCVLIRCSAGCIAVILSLAKILMLSAP